MSRNTEHRFISTDPGAVAAQLTARYEELFKTTVRPASPEKQLIQFMASVLVQERAMDNDTGNQNVPSRASGENLDALAELTHSKARPAAKPAVCRVRFEISEAQESAVLIPAGTRVTDPANTLIWETEADAYVPIGETAVELPVRCQTAGTAGNGYAAGQISTLIDVYDYYAQCVSVSESGGGSDVPDDDEYYELMRASMDAFSCAGSRGGYIYFAKQESAEIVDVAVNSPTPGVVKLYVLTDGGKLAGEELKAKVLAACSADDVRPLTDQVFVEDAETVGYDIDFTYYLQTGSAASAADTAAAVTAAVEEYKTWQCGRLGRDINPSRLIELLMRTGIKRVELRAPAFTVLRDGRDKQAPQVARFGAASIVNGGYEDE